MFIFIYINVKNIAFIHTMPHNNYLIMWSCSGNMPKYYSTKYHYKNLHEG